MTKSCLRCSNPFESLSGTKKYCQWCVSKHLTENGRKYKRKSRPELREYNKDAAIKRIKEANEKRAEYISRYFMETGVFLTTF